jgi:hypothetical protein
VLLRGAGPACGQVIASADEPARINDAASSFMLRNLLQLEGYKVHATDGDVGQVVNFLLDDERWVIRYLVVETGGLLDGRDVLISPISFGGLDMKAQRFNLKLTMAKIKASPSIDTHEPVSRQREREFHRHYGYPYYWGQPGLWGMDAYPGLLAEGAAPEAVYDHVEPTGDAHLRSAKELCGYHIEGTDKGIGHVEDFLVDDETWSIRYLAIDTSNWWFGKKVLIAPQWAKRISWAERKVFVDKPREVIKASPEWNPKVPLEREYETRLHAHYAQPTYWKKNDDRPTDPPRPSAPQSRF